MTARGRSILVLGLARRGSDGKSLNGELGATVGTFLPRRAWNYYVSFRAAGAHGYGGDVAFGGSTGTNVPPASTVYLGTLGAAGRIASHARFTIEGGYGTVVVHGRSDVGRTPYFSMGTSFDIAT